MDASAYNQIYVGELDSNVTEKMIYAHAVKIFPTCKIFSIRLVRDWVTGESLKYAYVNIEERDEAVKFINLLNHTELNGKEIRVMWKTPRRSNNPEANLFVNNINVHTTTAQLDQFFENYAPIVSSKLSEYTKKNEIKMKKAYVQLDSAEKAQSAIKEKNGSILNDSPVSVALFVPKTEREKKFTNLYVKNFPEGTTKEALAEVFSAHGTVTSTYIGLDSEGKPKVHENEDGSRTLYGFVNMKTHEEARAAAEGLNGTVFPNTKDCSIFVGRALKKKEHKNKLATENSPNCLYICSIHKEISYQELFDMFSKQGSIKFLNYPSKEDAKGFRFAYCYFENREQADVARRQMNGSTLRGSPLRVDFYKTAAQLQQENAMRRQQMQTPMYQVGYPHNNASRKSKPKTRGGAQRDNRNPRPMANAQMPQMVAPAAAPARPMPKILPLTEQEMLDMSNDDKHETFGERIYNYMAETSSEAYAGKITGMVLETFKGEFSRLNEIIGNGTIVDKINEAISVYMEHEKQTK